MFVIGLRDTATQEDILYPSELLGFIIIIIIIIK